MIEFYKKDWFKRISTILGISAFSIVAIVSIVIIIFLKVLFPNEFTIENLHKFFGVMKDVQYFDMAMGSLLTLVLIIIVYASKKSYSIYRQSCNRLDSACRNLNETSLLYDPLNDKGIIKPLCDKASEFIDKEKSPLIPLVHEAKNHLQQSKEALDQITSFERWGEHWKVGAMKALSSLQLEALKTHIILQSPEDYPRFLQEEGESATGDPAIDIKIVGSMVGFYVLLPSAIRNYICCLGNRFRMLEILAVDKKKVGKVTRGGDYEKMSYYALAFVAKTLESVLFNRCKTWTLKEDSELSFKITIRFSKFDFMNAAILIGNKSIVILQALDAVSAPKIIDDGVQIGLKAKKERDENFKLGHVYFERYDKVINGYFKEYEGEPEVWDITKRNINGSEKKIITLGITNRHWNDSFDFVSEPLNSEKTYTKTDEKDEIKDFLSSFKAKVCKEAGTTTLDTNVKLKRFDNIPCNCEKR